MLSRFLRTLKRRPRRASKRVLAETAIEQTESLENRTLLSTVTVKLSPSQDGTLYETENGSKANGAGRFLIVGPNNNASRRALVEFNVADSIPEGAVIVDVKLTLHNSGGIQNSRNVFLHPVTTPWTTGGSDPEGGEFSGAGSEPGDTTWKHAFFAERLWDNPGGDFAGTSASTRVTTQGFYEWSSDNMIEDVQAWLDDPASNHGWLLRSNESTRSVKRFDSSEHPNSRRRPVLEVTYELPPATSTIEGRKWHDKDVDGRKDKNEEWLDGWTIEIYDVDTGELVDTAVTGSVDLNDDGVIDPETEVGVYSFTTTSGTYEIREVLQPDWSQSFPGFSADFSRSNGLGASGGMSLVGRKLHFDFDVDNPTANSVSIDFFVPNGGGTTRRIANRPRQQQVGEGRVVGNVTLTSREVGHLINGRLTAALVNSKGRPRTEGPVRGTGSHIVTVSDGEVVASRNFGNYKHTEPPVPGIPVIDPDDPGAVSRRGVHFSIDDETGATVVVLAPQSIDPKLPEDHPDAQPVEARTIAGILNYLAKRDARIAGAVNDLFGEDDPLELFT